MPLPTVIMLDPPVHTAANGYRCDNDTCPCHSSEQEEQAQREPSFFEALAFAAYVDNQFLIFYDPIALLTREALLAYCASHNLNFFDVVEALWIAQREPKPDELPD